MQDLILYMKSDKANYNAVGIYNDGKIIVQKGSIIRKNNTSKKYKRSPTIEKLRSDPTLINNSMQVLRNIEFDSVSMAAQFVADTSRNGLLYWRNKSNKKLKEIIGG